jgi:hypothetical protein
VTCWADCDRQEIFTKSPKDFFALDIDTLYAAHFLGPVLVLICGFNYTFRRFLNSTISDYKKLFTKAFFNIFCSLVISAALPFFSTQWNCNKFFLSFF